MTSPQLQWELTKSLDSSLSIARGVIQASTSDNVQTLALIACERFGATLAICPGTCRKVEAQIIRLQSPTTAIIGFLGAVVGYSKDDCASQLARSLAGVQFIALGTALVTTIGAFRGGEVLAQMLRDSAADKTLLPPARHLKDLLASIEHKCVQLKFPDMILGWSKIFLDSSTTDLEDRKIWKVDYDVPNSEGIGGLVDAFRQLSRVGNATSITLKTFGCTAWVAALTQWCLGVPPSTYLEDGTAIIAQPKSNVTIIAIKGKTGMVKSADLEISIHRALNNPSDLITAANSGKCWTGMISIEAYGQWLLFQYDLNLGTAERAITHCLPYALKQVVTLLRPSILRRFDRSVELRDWHHQKTHETYPEVPDEVKRFSASPYPHDTTIARMLLRMLGSSDPQLSQTLPSLKDGLKITDLPLVSLHLEALRRNCPCRTCSGTGPMFEVCKIATFMRHLSSFTGDVLLLSLFDSPEALLVAHGLHRLSEFNSSVFDILWTGKPQTLPIVKVLKDALSLVGHEVSDELKLKVWVLSCYKGQAVFPKLFETHRLQDPGYLTLSWAPGLLRYDGEVYPKAIGDRGAGMHLGHHFPNVMDTMDVSVPINLVPKQCLVWRVVRADGFLKINAGIEVDGTWVSMLNSPFLILANLSSALVTPSCPDSVNNSLKTPDKWCQYTAPSEPLGILQQKSDPNITSVVATGDQDSLRMYSLGFYSDPFPFVIRNEACLACCLETCRTAGYPAIIY
jgi:hypothetical protein